MSFSSPAAVCHKLFLASGTSSSSRHGGRSFATGLPLLPACRKSARGLYSLLRVCWPEPREAGFSRVVTGRSAGLSLDEGKVKVNQHIVHQRSNGLWCYTIYIISSPQCHQFFDSLQELVDHINDFHVKPEKDSGYCCQWEGCARNGRGFNARYDQN